MADQDWIVQSNFSSNMILISHIINLFNDIATGGKFTSSNLRGGSGCGCLEGFLAFSVY